MKKSVRGFAYKQFTDLYGQTCSIQKSSLATKDCIWLGVEDTGPELLPAPPYRMHLTQAQVRRLLPMLHKFVETGEI